MKAHFFDVDTLIEFDGRCWIVDKNQPNKPIMKLSKSDFNLIRSGIWRSQGNKIAFNGEVFWLSNDIINTLKIKTKNHGINFGNLGISMQEFLNPELINEKDFDLKMGVVEKLKNTNDHIFIICSKQTKVAYDGVLKKLLEKLREQGILVKNYYHITDSFYNTDRDEINFKKSRLLLQHSLGYKTEGEKFIDEELTQYDEIEFYDDDLDTLKIAHNLNNLLQHLLSKSETGLREVIKENLRESSHSITVNQITDNSMKKTVSKKIILSLPTIIKNFESFKMRF